MPTKQPSRDHYVKDGRLIWPPALETEGKTPGDEQRSWPGSYRPCKYYDVHLRFIYTRDEPIDKPPEPLAAATPEDRQRWKDSGLYEEGETEDAVGEWVDWERFNNMELIRQHPTVRGQYPGFQCLQSYFWLSEPKRRGYDRILGRYENPPSQLFEEFRTMLTNTALEYKPVFLNRLNPTSSVNQLLNMPDNYDQLPQEEKDKITGPKADPLLPEFLKQQEPFKREQMMVMLNKDMPGNSDIMYLVFKHLMGILSPDETLDRVKVEETAANFEDMANGAVGGPVVIHPTDADHERRKISSYLPGAQSVYDWLGNGSKGGGGRRYKKKRRGTKKRTKKRRTKKRRTKKR